MHGTIRNLTLAVVAVIAHDVILAQERERPTLEGVVLRKGGLPLAGARVIISTARVRRGTSPY